VGQTVSSIDYFDSSALVKWYMAETGSAWVQARCNDPVRTIATVDLSRIEVAAAFAAKFRGEFITISCVATMPCTWPALCISTGHS
jgi:hypothetical protein